MRKLHRFFFTMLLILAFGALHAENNLQEIKQDISDSVITTKITAKFAKNQDLNPLKIFIKTEDGMVTLSGHVNDNQAFVDALRLAKSTKGVKSVEVEDLIIKPVNTVFTDAYITTKVEAAILKAKVFDDESIPIVGINAVTNNGAVTLNGKVQSNQSVLAIIRRVSAIEGVKKIISHLQVAVAQNP